MNLSEHLVTTRHTITQTTHSEDQTVELAARFAAVLRAGDVVALRGELGAGKTRFVKGLAQGLGHDPAHVSSPTYVLAHIYDSLAGRLTLVHIDAYRMSDADELPSLGWDRLHDGLTVVAIEWSPRIEEALPQERFEIDLEHIAEASRRVTISAPAERGRDVGVAIGAASRPHRCRICGGRADPASVSAPFCSERCRMADLGKWFSGDYKVSREIKDSDLDAGE